MYHELASRTKATKTGVHASYVTKLLLSWAEKTKFKLVKSKRYCSLSNTNKKVKLYSLAD